MNREAVERIAKALNDAGVPFIVVGGVAVIAHGYGRTTQGLGIVIRLDPATAHAAIDTLNGLGYRAIVPVTAGEFASERQRGRWVAEKGMTVLSFFSERYRTTAVDVFIKEPFDFGTE